jgi:cell division protein FtsB
MTYERRPKKGKPEPEPATKPEPPERGKPGSRSVRELEAEIVWRTSEIEDLKRENEDLKRENEKLKSELSALTKRD